MLARVLAVGKEIGVETGVVAWVGHDGTLGDVGDLGTHLLVLHGQVGGGYVLVGTGLVGLLRHLSHYY